MNIDKDQILQLLKSQGNHDQAAQAGGELPDQVDTASAEHQDLLSKFGLNASELPSMLGGSLGKIL